MEASPAAGANLTCTALHSGHLPSLGWFITAPRRAAQVLAPILFLVRACYRIPSMHPCLAGPNHCLVGHLLCGTHVPRVAKLWHCPAAVTDEFLLDINSMLVKTLP
jgi:hypothetical protein